jgi:HlyD family secretion protein
MAKNVKPKTRRWLIPLAVIVVLVAGGSGYYYWNQNNQAAAQQQAATASAPKTTTVRRGNITLSASGSGTLVPAITQQLNFLSAGTVAKLNVKVGDQVQQGQMLAQLDNLTTLQTAVDSAQQDLISAQQALDTLKQNGPANIGNAELAVANAQKAVDTAKAGYIVPGMQRCDQPTTDAYYSKYLLLKKQLDALGNGGGNKQYYLDIIVPAQINVNKAYQAYLSCAGFTNYETDASHATLAVALATLKTSQDTLTLLQNNNGINPTDLATAQNKISNAQVALDQAKQTLDGATLKAPIAGTVTAVAGQVGDQVGANTAFITLGDLAHPEIQFSVDETDLDKVAVGEQASVVFDAFPNQTFNGTVIQINPSLVTANNVQTVQGLIQLNLGKDTRQLFVSGMNSTVTLIKASADNVILVPIQAIRDLGNGQYGVFTVGPNNKLTLKFVQVGLMDLTNAEIKSGLQPGDVISTGASQLKQQ